MSCSLKVTQYMHQPTSQLYGIWMPVPKFLYRQLLAKSKEKPIYAVWLSALCFIQCLFSFDKLQPVIAQFDLFLFTS